MEVELGELVVAVRVKDHEGEVFEAILMNVEDILKLLKELMLVEWVHVVEVDSSLSGLDLVIDCLIDVLAQGSWINTGQIPQELFGKQFLLLFSTYVIMEVLHKCLISILA